MASAIVPPVAQVAAKWARRASSAGTEYTEGISQSKRSWAAGAVAAEKNYQTAVTQAAAAGRFGKGVTKAGDAKWKRNAVEKGPARYSQGVAVAEQDFSSQVAPFLQAIASVNMPERGPRGSESNYTRGNAIAKALFQLGQR